MGSDKKTQTQNTNQTYQAFATPMESQLNQQLQNNLNSTLPQAGQTQGSYLSLLNQGANAYSHGIGAAGLNGTPLGQAIGGITPEQQDQIVKNSMRYLDPQFQTGGYLNSGAAASIQSRTAADLLGQSAQFNVTNAGNVLQGLLAGNTNAQNITNQNAQQLSSNLAGLRTVNQFGNSTTTNLSQNPFVSSFLTSSGSAIGNGLGQGLVGGSGAVANGGTQTQGFDPQYLQSLLRQYDQMGTNPGNSFGMKG